MKFRHIKNHLYEQVAIIGKAVSSPKRLEMLEVLAQGAKTVELLADATGIDIKLASAHLRVLREARLVTAQREGRFMSYQQSGPDVSALWVQLRSVAEEHLVELKLALDQLLAGAEPLDRESSQQLLQRARDGDVIILDVRPQDEYHAAHLPYARSLPLAQLRQRMAELPVDKDIVAYCRGPFCVLASQAVELLIANGYRAAKLADGMPEWLASGLLTSEETA